MLSQRTVCSLSTIQYEQTTIWAWPCAVPGISPYQRFGKPASRCTP